MARPRRRGFTLLEMVLVLIILATIAGLVIPQLGFLGRTADMAATAKTQQDIANQLSLYFTLQKKAPTNLDSLLKADAAATPPFTVINPVNSSGAIIDGTTPGQLQGDQVWGLPFAGANGIKMHLALTPATLTNATNLEYKRSFTRLGFDFLLDHDPAVLNANNSSNRSATNVPRDLNASSPATACTVATVNLATAEGRNLLRQIYPASDPGAAPTLPPGVGFIVAVGVGASNSMIPDTMLNAPTYPGNDGKYYGRYIAYYAVFATGERAQLVGVSDSYGRFPNYSQQQFNESLPNSGRQG